MVTRGESCTTDLLHCYICVGSHNGTYTTYYHHSRDKNIGTYTKYIDPSRDTNTMNTLNTIHGFMSLFSCFRREHCED